MPHHPTTTRRNFCLGAAAIASLPLAGRSAERKAPAVRIGACDWSLGEPSPKAFELAAKAGLEGVQVSFGAPGGEWDLRSERIRETYLEAQENTGVRMASLGMGILNKQPYKSVPETEGWVEESIDTAAALGLRVVLLAFFGKGDLKEDPEGFAEVGRRLRKVAPRAAEKGVVLGIESWLSGEEHLRLLDAVGNPAVQVYYDTGNSLKKGYDIYAEIEELGRERICEFHAKDTVNGNFGKGPVEFPRVQKQIAKIGFEGWMQIEGKLDAGQFKANGAYLRDLFANS